MAITDDALYQVVAYYVDTQEVLVALTEPYPEPDGAWHEYHHKEPHGKVTPKLPWTEVWRSG